MYVFFSKPFLGLVEVQKGVPSGDFTIAKEFLGRPKEEFLDCKR